MNLVAPYSGTLRWCIKDSCTNIRYGDKIATIDGKSVVVDTGGTVLGRSKVAEGDTVEIGEMLVQLEACRHPALYAGMCVACGAKPGGHNRTALTISAGHTLQLSKEEASSSASVRRSGLHDSRKIALVLDLDHTLVH